MFPSRINFFFFSFSPPGAMNHGVGEQLHRLMMDRNAQVSARPSEPLSAAGLVPILPATLSPTQPVAHLPTMTPPFPGCPGTKL